MYNGKEYGRDHGFGGIQIYLYSGRYAIICVVVAFAAVMSKCVNTYIMQRQQFAALVAIVRTVITNS